MPSQLVTKVIDGIPYRMVDLSGTNDGPYIPADAAFDAAFEKSVVGTSRDKFRDEFFSFNNTTIWEVVQQGAGAAITVAGTTAGSRYLNIATGVGINEETIIQSRQSFKMPVKLAFGLSMSQRIVNQEVFVELVSVNSSGVIETDATFPSPNANNALNVVSYKFDSTVPTSAIYITRGFGTPELVSTSTALVSTTVATGTGPNFLPAGVWEINSDMEEAVFQTRAIDSVAAVNAAFKRTQNLPDPLKEYKIRIRVKNLSTAPASTTDVRLHFIRLLDTTRFTVDFARHMGRANDISDSLPVAISNTPAVTVASGTLTTLTTCTTLASMTAGWLGIPNTVADVVSAALTTTTTTAAIIPTAGTEYEVNISVTAVSGTTPTMDVVVQESDDTGTNWFDVYHFPRITAVGIYRSPKLVLKGNRIRYVQTVAGTTPSFTRAVNRLQGNATGILPMRRILDRAVSLTTLNAATANVQAQECRNVQLAINIGAVTTTAPALQLQGSEDNGQTWYSIGAALTAVASSTVQLTVNNVNAELVRAVVSTAGVGVTAGYVSLKVF